GRGRDGAAGAEALLDGGGGGGSTRPSLEDTLSLMGGVKRMVRGDPNVSLVMWVLTIREHPLRGLIGSILSCNPQREDFLRDEIDPLRDLEGVFMFGPRMVDTSKLTVLVHSKMEDSKLQRVMGLIAQQPGASFADAGVGARAVRFHADRADRVAFTHPRN